MNSETAKTVLQVLSVEDSPEDALLVERELAGLGRAVAWRRVESADRLLQEYDRLRPDLVLSDYSLPAFSGPEALRLVRERDRDVPFIFVSGHVPEEWVSEAMRQGATDFVGKDRLSRLVPIVERALREVAERKDRRRAEEILREGEEQTRLILDSALDAVITMDAAGLITRWNPKAETLFGWSASEVLGRLLSETIIPPAYRDAHQKGLERYLQTGSGAVLGRVIEVTALRRDGTEIPVELAITPLPAQGRPSFCAFLRDITARKRSVEVLRANEERLRVLIDHCPGSLALFDRDMRYLMVSPRWVKDYGLEGRELVGRSHYEIFPDLPERWKEIHRRCLAGATERCDEDPFPRAGGKMEWVRWEIHPWRDASGGIGGIFMFTELITERKRLEAQLLQAQRMEVIGRLAGGVAHDFNNLLTPILGYSELLLAELQPGAKSYEELAEVRKSAMRAAALTKQLLAFSRKQVLQPKVVDLNNLVTDIQKLLVRLIGEDIRLSLALDPGLGRVRIDPGQIEQVVMNLAINARDAMPRGGKLTLGTANVELGEDYAADHAETVPGPYVCLTVSDTGTGMDPETLSHLFEPFFTTKAPGKGTGLGLATVYGIVRQSNGHVHVTSELGHGSTFKVYFPRVDEKVGTGARGAPTSPAAGGTETLLVVEDEPTLRGFVTRALRLKGYQVIEASSGEDAIQRSRGHAGTLHLLLTDVVMPGMSGRDTSRKILESRPEMKVLFMSGYTGDLVAHHGVLDEGVALLEKPFTTDALLRRIREMLG